MQRFLKDQNELEAATRSTLPAEYVRGVNRADNFSGKTKEHFVRGVVFTESGELPFDVDPMQAVTNIKHMVTISLRTNDKPGEYYLSYDLD